MIVLAFAFFFAGKIESIIIDKKKKELQHWKTTLICTKESLKFPLSEVIDVRPIKTGHSGVNVYTLHYKIMVEFRTLPPFKITETSKEEKCIK